MKIDFLFAAVVVSIACSVQANDRTCQPSDCRTAFLMSSTSDMRSYGLLLEAGADCHRVRFRVEMAGQGFLGHTPPLGPGERAVVRMGRGFANGQHLLIITPEGCASAPVLARRVSLAKTSPDHEAQAAAF